jgi:hypothetical protein
MPKNFTLRVVAIYPDTQKVEFSFTIEGFAEPWSFEIPTRIRPKRIGRAPPVISPFWLLP